MTHKTSSSFTICHIFALEINYFPVLLAVRALRARLPKGNKHEVVLGSRVTLPENFACKPRLSFNPIARVTLAVGLPYLLVNRALIHFMYGPVGVCNFCLNRGVGIAILLIIDHRITFFSQSLHSIQKQGSRNLPFMYLYGSCESTRQNLNFRGKRPVGIKISE